MIIASDCIMNIRQAKNQDQKEISRLYQQLYYEEESSDIIPTTNSQLKSILLVAEEQDKIIGFIWANCIAFGIRRYGYLEDLYVDDKYRAKGVAKSLISAVKDEFKEFNVNAVFVTTEKENQIAQNLYIKEGFSLCSGPWFVWIPK